MPNESLLILIVDDSPDDRATYRRYLSRDPAQTYEIAEEGGIEAGLETLARMEPSCILLDYAMPDGTGLEFLHELQKRAKAVRPPVIMLTGTGDEAIAVRAMKTGASDYLVKGVLTPENLRLAISAAIYRHEVEGQLQTQRDELARLYALAQEAHEAKDLLVQQLREANSAKDQFLATLSHELRTPLTPILLAVSSIPEEQLSGEVREMFATIRRNVALEARLIDDLLDLTRVSKGKLRLNLEGVDAHEILQSVIEICRADFESKSLRLAQNFTATSHFVHADSARLQQVFWNLLKNAAKFTPAHGCITIETHSPEADRIAISFTDTGLGIPAERLPKIFDAFEQGGTAVTQRFGGLGLGLAISKAIVAAHTGKLSASSPGAKLGSTFVVELAASATAPVATENAPSGSARCSAEILLVEDHEDSAALLARSLSRVGFRVHVAHSIDSALELFRAKSIDVLVSDLGLPDGHGTELLRLANAFRPVRAIALSGYGFEHDLKESRRAGFHQHLIKPVEPQTLRQAIEQVLADSPNE